MTEYPRTRWRLLVAPTGSESVGLLLAAWLLLRGTCTLLWNGMSGASASDMYCYALHLAPEWFWGAIPAAIGGVWLVAILRHWRARRGMALVATWWFVAWAALLALGRPELQVLTYAGPLLVMAAGAAWSWLVLGWQNGGR